MLWESSEIGKPRELPVTYGPSRGESPGRHLSPQQLKEILNKKEGTGTIIPAFRLAVGLACTRGLITLHFTQVHSFWLRTLRITTVVVAGSLGVLFKGFPVACLCLAWHSQEPLLWEWQLLRPPFS